MVTTIVPVGAALVYSTDAGWRMEEPQIGRENRRIRREGTSLCIDRFLRYKDGSGMVEADGRGVSGPSYLLSQKVLYAGVT